MKTIDLKTEILHRVLYWVLAYENRWAALNFKKVCKMKQPTVQGLCSYSFVRVATRSRAVFGKQKPRICFVLFKCRPFSRTCLLGWCIPQLECCSASMQGVKPTVLELSGKIEGFKKKVSMWARKVEERNIQIFYLTESWLKTRNCVLNEYLLIDISIDSPLNSH